MMGGPIYAWLCDLAWLEWLGFGFIFVFGITGLLYLAEWLTDWIRVERRK